MRQDITRADADLICMSFNATVARWLTEYNFPGARPPEVWRVMDEPEDINTLAERDERLARIGYRPTLARVTEVYGEGYEPIHTPQTETGNAIQAYADQADDIATDQQALDDALAAIPQETLMRQAWEAASPALRRVLAAGDYQTAMGLLADLYPAMPDDGLQELLARLLFAAQVWGALSAEAELADGRG